MLSKAEHSPASKVLSEEARVRSPVLALLVTSAEAIYQQRDEDTAELAQDSFLWRIQLLLREGAEKSVEGIGS